MNLLYSSCKKRHACLSVGTNGCAWACFEQIRVTDFVGITTVPAPKDTLEAAWEVYPEVGELELYDRGDRQGLGFQSFPRGARDTALLALVEPADDMGVNLDQGSTPRTSRCRAPARRAPRPSCIWREPRRRASPPTPGQ